MRNFDGSFKVGCKFFFSVFSAFGLCAWPMVLLGMILTTFPLELCLCWHYRAKYVGNDNDRYFLVLIL